MNTKTTLQLLTLLLLFLSSVSLRSQCAVPDIIHDLDGIPGVIAGACTPGDLVGQTFMACEDAEVTEVSVVLLAPIPGFLESEPGTYELYMTIEPGPGIAVTGTFLVATEVVAATPTNGDILTFTLGTPFPVVDDGTMYRMVVTNTTGNFILQNNSGNDYPDGVFVEKPSTYNATQDLDFRIRTQPVANLVPTLSEWGLIILALLIMTMGMLYVTSPVVSLSSGHTVKEELSFKNLPFRKESYFKILARVIILASLLLTTLIFIFGYELTNADPFGLLVSIPILSYLVMLFLLEKEKS